MYNIERAFKIACRKGYAEWDDQADQCFVKKDNGGFFLAKEQVLLDPKFWEIFCGAVGGDATIQFHAMVDHLIAGGNLDDFFSHLVAQSL